MSVPAIEKWPKGKPRGLSALWRSYAADLRGWAVSLAAGYGIAAALLIGGMLAVFGAITIAAIGLMTWMWLSAINLLVGAELNSEIEGRAVRAAARP
jgi:uncharacterized BrkB/YihY/UPF0761 family membrane protein